MATSSLARTTARSLPIVALWGSAMWHAAESAETHPRRRARTSRSPSAPPGASSESPHHSQTTTGQTVEVIHRGVWSNGFGPDFRDALLLFDGRELRAGSVEIHRRRQVAGQPTATPPILATTT